MPKTTFACPACATVLRSPHPLPSGKVVKCPRCGTAARVQPVGASGGTGADSPAGSLFIGGLIGTGIVILIIGTFLGGLWGAGSFSHQPAAARAGQTAKGSGKAKVAAGPDKAGQKKPAAQRTDLSMIAADFTGAVVIRPQRLLQSPLLAGLPRDQMFAALDKLIGADSRQVEQITVLFEPFPGGNVAFFFAVIVRFAKAVDGKQVVTRTLPAAREQTFNGKTYYAGLAQNGPVAGVMIAGYTADDRTLVFAPEPTLHKMLNAANARSPLRDRLPKLDLNQDVTALFVLEPGPGKPAGPTVRQALAEALKEKKDSIPPNLQGAAAAVDHLQAVTAALNLGGATLLSIDLEADTPESATTLHELAKSGQDMANLIYPEFRKALAPQMPPDVAPSVLTVLDETMAGLRLSKNANHVSMHVKTPPSLGKLAEKLGPLLQQAMPAQ